MTGVQTCALPICTLDKLESIAGFDVALSSARLREQLAGVGAAVFAAGTLAPADAKLYALRDVTATVESLPLIASSVMSKKLAEGTDALVLDVKVGSGAFMKELDDARELAQMMVGLGEAHGVATRALLTEMSVPLGRAVGNAIEVNESLEVLAGGGPADVVALTVRLAREMLALAGIGDADPAQTLRDGTAMDRFTAMVAAQALEATLGSAHYAKEYQAWHERMEGVDRDQWTEHRLLPHPSARVRVYSTHSTHKSLSALRQASMIHVRDQDFNALARESFTEAFLTHTSTSPNQQLLASLDLARRQVDIEGFDMVRRVYDMALVFRHRVRKDRLISKWFHILDESDLVPDRFRASTVSSYRQVRQGALAEWNEAWRSDEFVLDPTRVTLYIGKTGMTGFDFREKILMQRFGIQINKTSINSVLLIFTIGVTWSSVHYLLDALRRVAGELDRTWNAASNDDRALQRRRIAEITEDLPPLPDFSAFAPAFRPVGSSTIGDMRAAFYGGYEETDREHVLLGDAGRRVSDGKTLVSTTFVVPYPPGFPVLVPGQVISKEILYFLAELDVKEIHGYNPDLGLAVFTQEALARYSRIPSSADLPHRDC